MFGSWVDDAVWMELLHGWLSASLFVFFPAPAMQKTQGKKIKCNMNFLDDLCARVSFFLSFFSFLPGFHHLLAVLLCDVVINRHLTSF